MLSDDCRRDYTFPELAVDVIGRRYYFCPLCRSLGCRTIAAALDERLERSRQLVKESDRLMVSSTVLAAESQALARRVLEARSAPLRAGLR